MERLTEKQEILHHRLYVETPHLNGIGYASVQLCGAGLAGWASAWLGLVCPGLLAATHHDHNKYHEHREWDKAMVT